MKTALGFLTEEGRTRSKNGARRTSAYAVVMLLVAGAGGYAIYKYWVASNLTTLQRIYFKIASGLMVSNQEYSRS